MKNVLLVIMFLIIASLSWFSWLYYSKLQFEIDAGDKLIQRLEDAKEEKEKFESRIDSLKTEVSELESQVKILEEEKKTEEIIIQQEPEEEIPNEDADKINRDAIRISNAKQLQLALELHYDGNAKYPETLSELGGVYIAEVPKDPLDETLPTYKNLAEETSYYLGVNLENAGHDALAYDTDTTSEYIDGDDTDGCDGQIGRYCYDVSP